MRVPRRILTIGNHIRAALRPGSALVGTYCATSRLQTSTRNSTQAFAAAAAAAGLAAVAVAASPLSCESQSESSGSIKLKDGRVLFYRSVGEGTPVIALHGMGSSSLTWKQAKAEPGVRLIALDRPGYGGSSPPPACYSYAQFASDLLEFADAMALDRFCVAGHSSGGPYALAAAAVLPERVVACASVSSDPPYMHPRAPDAVRLSDDFSQPSKSVVEKRLEKLGLNIPKPAVPVANYVAWRQSGNVVYISGQIPKDGEKLHRGIVGADASTEDAVAAARLCGLNLIAQMREACDGNLDRVKKILQVQGFVSCTPDFTAHPQVINGVSDLLVEVFGKEVGTHSRFAVGSSSLPLGVPVEVGAIIEIAAEEESTKLSAIGLYGKDPVALAGKWSKEANTEDKRYAWQQGVGGWVCDFALERLPWSFSLEEISLGERLSFWVGEKDVPAIIAGTPFMHTLVPGSKMNVVPGGDHGFKRHPEHLSAILQELRKHWLAAR